METIGFLTWLLISGLTLGFSGTLGGNLYYYTKTECLKRSIAFAVRQQEDPLYQGPVNQCGL